MSSHSSPLRGTVLLFLQSFHSHQHLAYPIWWRSKPQTVRWEIVRGLTASSCSQIEVLCAKRHLLKDQVFEPLDWLDILCIANTAHSHINAVSINGRECICLSLVTSFVGMYDNRQEHDANNLYARPCLCGPCNPGKWYLYSYWRAMAT